MTKKSKRAQSQISKFRKTARILETDESEAAFNATLGKIMNNKTPSGENKRPKKQR